MALRKFEALHCNTLRAIIKAIIIEATYYYLMLGYFIYMAVTIYRNVEASNQ